MEVSYALVLHDDDPETWRWWTAVHEVYRDPENGVRHWCKETVPLLAIGGDHGPATLLAEIARIHAEVSASPVLSTRALMAEGGRAIPTYGEAAMEEGAVEEPRMAAE